MPTKELMSYVPSRKGWLKEIDVGGRKKMLSRSARQLAKEFPDLVTSLTQEGSREAANLWYETNHKPGATPELAADYAIAIANLRRQAACHVEGNELEQAEALQESIAQLQAELASPKPRAIHPMMKEANPFADPVNAAVWQDRLNRVDARKKAVGSNSVEAKVKAWTDKVAARAAGGLIDPQRFESYRCCVNIFKEWLGADEPISIIDGPRFEAFFNHLIGQVGLRKKKPEAGLSSAYASTIFMTARQFIVWLAETQGAIPMPGNINSKLLQFPKGKKKIKTFTIDEAKALIAGCGKSEETGARTKLYLLLMLNCGMYQSDISDLGASEFNAKAGTITRKRSKGEKHEDCPEVTYRLWPETLRLLKKYRNSNKSLVNKNGDVRVLVTDEDGPLVPVTLEGQKLSKTDNVQSAYRRLQTRLKIVADKKPLKLIRKTSSSLLATHKDYKFYAQYFLGQSARTVADNFYVIPSNKEFFEALEWLRKQYGF